MMVRRRAPERDEGRHPRPPRTGRRTRAEHGTPLLLLLRQVAHGFRLALPLLKPNFRVAQREVDVKNDSGKLIGRQSKNRFFIATSLIYKA
jgi:hypothetical protein